MVLSGHKCVCAGSVDAAKNAQVTMVYTAVIQSFPTDTTRTWEAEILFTSSGPIAEIKRRCEQHLRNEFYMLRTYGRTTTDRASYTEVSIYTGEVQLDPNASMNPFKGGTLKYSASLHRKDAVRNTRIKWEAFDNHTQPIVV
jgi:hypothetical protein